MISEKHAKAFKKLSEANNVPIVFLERLNTNRVEPHVYKTTCVPSMRDKTLVNGVNTKANKSMVVRVLIEDLLVLMSANGEKKFCSIDEIQQKMDKVVINKQRYNLAEVSVNNFNTIVVLYLSIED